MSQLADEWDKMAVKASQNFNPDLVHALRATFYAGAMKAHAILLIAANTGDPAHAAQVMDSLTRELVAFMNEKGQF